MSPINQDTDPTVKKMAKKAKGRQDFIFEGRRIYSWEQSLDEVHIYIHPLPPGAGKHDFDIKILPREVKIGLKGNPPFINEELFSKADTDDSFWMLEDRDDDEEEEEEGTKESQSEQKDPDSPDTQMKDAGGGSSSSVPVPANTDGVIKVEDVTNSGGDNLNGTVVIDKKKVTTVSATNTVTTSNKIKEKELHIILGKVHKGETWGSVFRKHGRLDLFTEQEVQKKIMLERFQEEHPGFDFSGAEFSGQAPDARNFMGGVKYS